MAFRDLNFAGLPAIRAIILAVDAESDALLPVAIAAVAFAGTLALREIALRANDVAVHGLLKLDRAAELKTSLRSL
jgi:hypothetical protein